LDTECASGKPGPMRVHHGRAQSAGCAEALGPSPTSHARRIPRSGRDRRIAWSRRMPKPRVRWGGQRSA
jgi:hypothetical protein